MPSIGESEERNDNDSIIKPIDALSAHKITSGQVVTDLQTAVKELVENSLDAGATSIEVRFKGYGLDSIEVVDNGSGIEPADYEAVALKHHTSKLASFADLASVATFGFRGEAISSLCALAELVVVTTATAAEVPMGTVLKFNKFGKLSDKSGRVARQRGTTVAIMGLFKPLPVRRKELERNAKREFGKALHLLNAYALVPCATENGGVRLSCSNQPAGGKKSEQIRTDGTASTRASISALWGPKTLENLEDLDLKFEVETEKSVLRRLKQLDDGADCQTNNEVRVRGVISKFALNCGRSSTDRQFFYINGRPCQPSKVQKAFNEIYRTFNVAQSPLIIADFILPKDSLDINVSPDKRTIFIHSEDNLLKALKAALEERFASERSTYNVHAGTTASQPLTQTQLRSRKSAAPSQCSLPTPPESQEQGESFAEEQVEVETPPVSRDVTLGPKGATGSLPLFLDVSDDEDAEMTAPTASNVDDNDTSGFGRPVLLVGGEDRGEPNRTRTTTQQSFEVDFPSQEANIELTQAVEAEETEVMDVDPPDEGFAANPPKRRTPRPETSSRHHEKGTSESSLALQPSSSTNVIEPSATPSRVIEETIHQIPPPRFISRSPASGSSLSASSSTRAAATRVPPVIASPPKPPSPRPLVGASKGVKRSAGQMTLSTSGAAWSLQSQDGNDDEPTGGARKKPKTAEGGKKAFKALLAGYARPGSQAQTTQPEPSDEDEDEEDEIAEREGPLLDVGDTSEDELMEDVQEAGDDASAPIENPLIDQSTSAGASAADAIDLTQVEETSENVDMLVSSSVHPVESEIAGDDSELPEIVKSAHRDMVTMRCDPGELASRWASYSRSRAARARATSAQAGMDAENSLSRDAGLANADNGAKADEVLSRIIEKSDFAQMEALGQFNLGFIIVRRQKLRDADGVADGMDDLFIVDQHAADEKYNFETLQQTTKIESQKLFRPKPLEFSAPDELVALDNLDVLRQNGFEVEVADESVSDLRRHRLSLVAQPVSKSTAFDLRDLEEIIHLLQDQPQGQMVRCSKARAMFAMRACRKSIMVGMPLTTKQMTNVVRHMGTMDQPWNCPHGRPTMRHLSDISGTGWDPAKPRDLNWQEFLDNDDEEEI